MACFRVNFTLFTVRQFQEHEALETLYLNEIQSQTGVVNGFKGAEGRENSRGGRLNTVRNPGKIAKFGDMLVKHRQMTLQLHVNRNTSRQIPHEYLGKICANSSKESDGQAKGAQGHVLTKTSRRRDTPHFTLSQLRRYWRR